MNTLSQDTPVLTVSELTDAIKQTLEKTFPLIRLQGEVSNCKLNTSGHLYFSLKDANAQISAVMFRGNVSALQRIPKDGDKVIVLGSINVYPPSGKYQIVVQEMTQVGLGALLLKLEELKQKLHKMGWFSKAHKKPIPAFPKKIGVVTSPTGAAIQDMLNVLTRRFYGFHLILNPVKVQGEGAAKEIARAIEQFNEENLVDVMIVGRGGGSIEDLWAFNEEIVASAIYNSKIPIICAVGHETDHCIAEHVADVRAPTPSAAAEMVIKERAQHLQHLDQSAKRLQQTISHLIRQNKNKLEGLQRMPVLRSPYTLLGQKMQKLDSAKTILDQAIRQICIQKKTMLTGAKTLLQSLKPTAQIEHSKQKLFSLEKQVDQFWQRSKELQKERLKNLVASLRTIDPKNLLSKGYSIVISEKENLVINSVLSLKKEMDLRILLSDGETITKVKEINYREQKK